MRRTAYIALTLCGLGTVPVFAHLKDPELIQIGVEVVEVHEDKAQSLGIEWFNALHLQEADVPALLQVGTARRGQIFADIRLLLTEGAADLLANPKLVTRDGTTASFHAGGEIPYIVASGLGTTSVEFKTYGVELQISPRIESDGRIALKLQAQVSSPDEQRGVFLSGNQVPGLLTREVSSQLLLSQGMTVTLAGLIQNQQQSQIRGVPILSKIPLLGLLFRHKITSHRRTSIVVFVTPVLLEGGVSDAPKPAA